MSDSDDQGTGEFSYRKKPLIKRELSKRVRKPSKFFDDEVTETPVFKSKASTLAPRKKICDSKATRSKPKIKAQNAIEKLEAMAGSGTSIQKLRARRGRPPSKHEKCLSSPSKLTAQALGIQLRNMLKLPKAYKWAIYEFFYSNIDKALLEGESDFRLCLKESFPTLKTRLLSRPQWRAVRRMMGKPRRCSIAFLREERRALNERRMKIRLLQQRKPFKLSNFKDLPEEIPLSLVLGTKVTARLRSPEDGLFIGNVAAVDVSNYTYRIQFERQGLGTRSIPDFEVQSFEKQQTHPVIAFMQMRKRNHPFNDILFSDSFSSTGFLEAKDLLNVQNGMFAGFPFKFLVFIVRLTKVLEAKRNVVKSLRELNSHAEVLHSNEEPYPLEFQRMYTSLVLQLDKINRDLMVYQREVSGYFNELHGNFVLEKSDLDTGVVGRTDSEIYFDEAKQLTGRFDSGQIQSRKAVNLVTHLATLMLQMRLVENEDINTVDLQTVADTMRRIKDGLHKDNVEVFEQNVEIHVNHIHTGLTQLNTFYSGL